MTEVPVASALAIALLMFLAWLVRVVIRDASIVDIIWGFGFVSPLIMSYLLLKVSGVGLLEKTVSEGRPEYSQHVRTTNAFFPGPPRKS